MAAADGGRRPAVGLVFMTTHFLAEELLVDDYAVIVRAYTERNHTALAGCLKTVGVPARRRVHLLDFFYFDSAAATTGCRRGVGTFRLENRFSVRQNGGRRNLPTAGRDAGR